MLNSACSHTTASQSSCVSLNGLCGCHVLWWLAILFCWKAALQFPYPFLVTYAVPRFLLYKCTKHLWNSNCLCFGFFSLISRSCLQCSRIDYKKVLPKPICKARLSQTAGRVLCVMHAGHSGYDHTIDNIKFTSLRILLDVGTHSMQQ